MTLAPVFLFGYRRGVRVMFALFVALVMVLSGIHAGPAEAHEQASGAAAHALHGGDGGQEQPDLGDQHVCHHHCPSGSMASAPETQSSLIYAPVKPFSAAFTRLNSTASAPPLDPPIA